MIWRYSWRDSIPCSITLFQLGLSFWLAATWESRTLAQNLIFVPLCVFLFWYNGLVASHNFVHTPWFQSNFLNRIYAALNSLNIGLPQSHYHLEHLKHHRYGNDRPDQNGLTKDPTSTFAHGKNGQHEDMVSYCFLGLFRTDLVESFQEIVKRGGAKQLSFELITCVLGLVVYLALSWQYFLFLYLPCFYLGWVLEHLENYYEHFGGMPEDKYANSTSYYGKLYNSLFCNEGYHQEHHLRPNVHWLDRPQTRQELQEGLNKAHRVILNFPPTLAWLEHQRIEYQHVYRLQLTESRIEEVRVETE
nr:MAG: fatty acid desaturase [Leptolyngbya sp. IPPAS B-1204]